MNYSYPLFHRPQLFKIYGHFDHTFIRYTRISDAWQIVISVKFTVKYHWKSEAQYEKKNMYRSKNMDLWLGVAMKFHAR